MEIKVGDKIQTPRFMTVRIAAVFESVELAAACKFTNGTDLDNPDYEVLGRSIGDNRMLFAAAKRG